MVTKFNYRSITALRVNLRSVQLAKEQNKQIDNRKEVKVRYYQESKDLSAVYAFVNNLLALHILYLR